MRRTARLPLPLLLTALLLAGCTDPTPMPTPPPTPSETPVFASDEEALAAAEEAYAEYISTVDAILADGGANPERLAPLVSDEVFARESAGFKSYVDHGWHAVGQTSFHLVLQQFDNAELTAYVCENISDTDVLDSSGQSIVQEDRSTRFAFEVRYALGADLILTAKDPWTGGGVCAP